MTTTASGIHEPLWVLHFFFLLSLFGTGDIVKGALEDLIVEVPLEEHLNDEGQLSRPRGTFNEGSR